jgi:hypothetical protein
VREIASREGIILPKLHRTCRAVQVEHGFTATTDHMDMGRPVVVWIDHDAKPIEPKNGRHRVIIAQFLSAWV